MPIVRRSLILLVSLLLIASAMARPTTRPDTEIPPASATEGDIPPAPHPADQGALPVRGGGGVGFSGPRRQEQLHAIQHLLGAGDNEWKSLAPKIEKVLVAKQNTSSGAGMNWTVSKDARPVFLPSSAKPDTAPGKAMQDVHAAVADLNASKERFARAMAAVREARNQARVEYEAAQNELFKALTPRQQAILMTIGVVE